MITSVAQMRPGQTGIVVGLRGAADKDGDGRVTLFEAYGYAYNQTLLVTAETKVGKQHVTLETKLRGRGEMVLTKPARATAALRLPRDLSAQVLVHRHPNQVVVAELSKAPGKGLRLALPRHPVTSAARAGVLIERPGRGNALRRAEPENVGEKSAA